VEQWGIESLQIVFHFIFNYTRLLILIQQGGVVEEEVDRK
jgi:hypothetical protein